MTNEKALKMLKAKRECIIKEIDPSGGCDDEKCDGCDLNYEQGRMGEQAEALHIAIESLEKETPRMVNYEGDGYADGYMVYDMAECPACGNRIDEEDVDVWEVAKYCPECGQRIIWEAENE